MKCPLCEGTGSIALKCEPKIKRVLMLRGMGLTIRQIAKVMKFKSPNTVDYYLNGGYQRIKRKRREGV